MIHTELTSRQIEKARVGRSTHWLLAFCIVTCLTFFIWASIFTLDIVSLASGEVIPSTQIKSVQHLEGGIIRKISTSEGEEVNRGQELIVLEPTQSGADVGEIRVRLLSLKYEIIRLEAEVEGATMPSFTDNLVVENPKMVEQTLARFIARKESLQSRIDSQYETIAQRDQEIKEISASIKNLNQNLELMKEQISISEELLKEDLTNRYNHLDLLKEANGFSLTFSKSS